MYRVIFFLTLFLSLGLYYIGVDNPLTVAVAGVPNSQLTVTGENIQLTDKGNGSYIARCNKPGNTIIVVTGPDFEKRIPFRVRRIPDPLARVGTQTGGFMSKGTFKAQSGLSAYIAQFEFADSCEIIHFHVVRLTSSKEINTAKNIGAVYSGEAKKFINEAESGDTYFFENVRVQCPGDKSHRTLNSIMIRILE